MSLPQLNLIGIVVEDMARSLAFYRQLGLDAPADADTQPHAEVTLAGGVRVAWDTVATIRSFDPDLRTPMAPDIALAFRLDTPAEADATYDRVVSAGYRGHKAPWDAFWGQRYAIIHDPDRHTVELFAALEGDQG